jgi:hypothetical protein
VERKDEPQQPADRTSLQGVLLMRVHFAILAAAGWFLMVAPSPRSSGGFDATAPLTEWSARSQMFASRQDCERYRNEAASSGILLVAGPGQFVSDTEAATHIPKSDSRCFDAGPPWVNLRG